MADKACSCFRSLLLSCKGYNDKLQQVFYISSLEVKIVVVCSWRQQQLQPGLAAGEGGGAEPAACQNVLLAEIF